MCSRDVLLLLLASAAVATCQWPQLCPNQKHWSPTSFYNETRCPAEATCCGSGFDPSEVGCCTLGANATCCGGYACCAAGTECKQVAGHAGAYDAVFDCVPPGGGPATKGISVCKGGAPLPMATDKKNVIWIGDSLSLGQMPWAAANVSSFALLQHSPWGGDGGAEETAYGLYCMPHFLHSPAGFPIRPDLVLFNFGAQHAPPAFASAPASRSSHTHAHAQRTRRRHARRPHV